MCKTVMSRTIIGRTIMGRTTVGRYNSPTIWLGLLWVGLSVKSCRYLHSMLNILRHFMHFLNLERSCRVWETGMEYRGSISETKKGYQCLPWRQVAAHGGVNMFNFEEEHIHGQHNYCRNPGGFRVQPWCFTAQHTWDYCDIPYCGQFNLVQSFSLGGYF